MKTNYKELVLAWIDRYANSYANPDQGVTISRDSDQMTTIEYNWRKEFYARGDDFDDEDWREIARILKLEKPQAKAIEWNPFGESTWLSAEGYNIDFQDGKYHACYYSNDIAPGFDTFGEAKSACQAHKQKRLEELL